MVVLFCIPNIYNCYLLVGQAPVSGYLSLRQLVAAYENHSRKHPTPVTADFCASQGCQLMRASTVVLIQEQLKAQENMVCTVCVHHQTQIKINYWVLFKLMLGFSYYK